MYDHDGDGPPEARLGDAACRVEPAAAARWLTANDAGAIRDYNALASDEYRLRSEIGPLPYEGSPQTAPIVLLLASPRLADETSPNILRGYSDGWPLSSLHPDAPLERQGMWNRRLAALIDIFGAQHIANSVLGLYLTPWTSQRFDGGLRLPSRPLMLKLAARTAARGAMLIVMRAHELWTEAGEIGALGPAQLAVARSWQASHFSSANLGPGEWDEVCRRVGEHRWRAGPEAAPS